MVALVHLVTLGWITFSIVGAIYIVGPLALRMRCRHGVSTTSPTRSVVGLIGMVAHFWIEEYGGMAWSAGTVTCGVLSMTIRIVDRVRRATSRVRSSCTSCSHA